MKLQRDSTLEMYEMKKMMLHEGFSAIPTTGGHFLPTVWLSEYEGKTTGRPLDPTRAHTKVELS